MNWTAVYNEQDVNTATDIFQSLLTDIINKHVPVKRIRCRINSAPWVTPEFFGMLDRLEYWARQCHSHPCDLYFDLKKASQRYFQRLKNHLKSEYIKLLFERHKNNPKKLWRDIRSFWPNSKSNKKCIQHLNGLSKKKILPIF